MSSWQFCPACRVAHQLDPDQTRPSPCPRCQSPKTQVVSQDRLTALSAACDLFEIQTPVRPQDVAPPDAGELTADAFLFESKHRPFLNGTGPSPVRLPLIRWGVAVIWTAVLALFIIDLMPYERPAVLLVLGAPTVLLVGWLAVVTRDRYRLRKGGTVLRGVVQCLSAKTTGDGDEYYWLTLGYVFATPAGGVFRGSTNQLVGRQDFRNTSASGKSPLPGDRRAIAVLYTPQSHRVL